MAPLLPRSFDDLRRFCDDSLRAREGLAADGSLVPSQMWKMGTHTFAYVRHLPDWELEKIRRHTDHVTGDSYIQYHYFSERVRAALRDDYLYLSRRLGFEPTEGESGIGFDFGAGGAGATGGAGGDDLVQMQGAAPAVPGLQRAVRVSRDLVRYLRVVDDLVQSGALAKSATGAFLEIGGGYGGLAATIHQYAPQLAYVIVDLEETQFLQATNLAVRFGFAKLRLCAGGLDDAPLEPGCFHLVPQHRAESIAGRRFAVAANQQSMQEMTRVQVERYCRLLARCADRFYSCNLDRHPDRFSAPMGLVADLGALLASHFGPPIWRPATPGRVQRLLGALHGRDHRREKRIGDSSLPRALYDCKGGARSATAGR
jgi:SAM-dependent methyltransferase